MSLNSVWVKSLTGPRSGSKSNSFEKLAISGVNDSGAELLSHPTSVAASSVIAAYFFTSFTDSGRLFPIILANTVVYTNPAKINLHTEKRSYR